MPETPPRVARQKTTAGRSWVPRPGDRQGVLLLVLLVGWFALASAVVLTFTGRRFEADLRRVADELDQHTAAASDQFDRSVSFMYGVPATLAEDPAVLAFLAQAGKRPYPDGAGVAAKRAVLASVPGFGALNHRMALVCKEMGIDVVWVVAASGDCVSSANFDKPESFIGVNYADRDYFSLAMAGHRGRQYAVGRTTNIPGFYFSAPVEQDGRPVGLVVAKIDVSRFSQWFRRFDCFITDEEGVITLSSVPGLTHFAVSGAPVFQRSRQEREAKYKWEDFQTLAVGHLDARLGSHVSARFPGSSCPSMLASHRRDTDGYTIYSFKAVPEVNHQGLETAVLLLLFCATGAACIFVAWGLRKHFQHTKALRESEAQNRALLSAIPDLIFMNTREGEYLAVHAPEPRLLIAPREALIRRTFETVLPGPLALRFQRATARALETSAVQELEYILPIDGQDRQFEARIAPCSGDKVITLVRDVTLRVATERDHRQLESQLQHAQKMESLGNLAGGIAHDMNNVLGAILMMASSQQDALDPGTPAHHGFEIIAQAALRGAKMVKSLLTFARKDPAQEGEIDLNAILRDEVGLLERTTLARLQLEMDLDPGLPPIRGDASGLANAFMNLCINALDAMPLNGTLTIRTLNLDDGRVEVQFQDTGDGMPREVLDRALEPYFTTKEVGKGTGLGLSMVYSTVKAHRGHLELRSEPGRGTLVIMQFPASGVRASGPEPLARPLEEPAPCALHLLLVDDDELIHASLPPSLARLGHRVTGAWSGEEALGVLAAGLRPDAVILDLNMPGLGGAETLPRLHALCPKVPVLLATGRPDQTALALLCAHPYATLLCKPFTAVDLLRHLRTTLGGTRATDANPAPGRVEPGESVLPPGNLNPEPKV